MLLERSQLVERHIRGGRRKKRSETTTLQAPKRDLRSRGESFSGRRAADQKVDLDSWETSPR